MKMTAALASAAGIQCRQRLPNDTFCSHVNYRMSFWVKLTVFLVLREQEHAADVNKRVENKNLV